MRRPSTIVSADWSKHAAKRAVYVADVALRSVRREPSPSWTLGALLALADRLPPPVLVGLDVALGVPAAYFRAALTSETWRDCPSFLAWLAAAPERTFVPVDIAEQWTVETPFLRVGKGIGTLTAYRVRTTLERAIDLRTGAKPLFAISGIPGTVGSGTRALWQELQPLLGPDRTFGLWPFDGDLESLLDRRSTVLAEMYPGIAYTTALCDPLPHARLRVAKTLAAARSAAIERLRTAAWPEVHGVTFHDLDAAEANEDDFDALLFAAAALRCVLEDRPLAGPADAVAEGGMLLSTLVSDGRGEDLPSDPARPRTPRGIARCPIPECAHAFKHGRAGWDAHVGSVLAHPDWRPDVLDAARRRALFREEFVRWFDTH